MQKVSAEKAEITRAERDRWAANVLDEMNGATLYDALGKYEANQKLAEVFRRMAAAERRHAGQWLSRLEKAGVVLPTFHPSWRTRVLVWLIKHFGVSTVLPLVMSFERADANKYSADSTAASMAADEKSHSRLLGAITKASPAGMEGGALARMEGRHRATGGNALRAAVLGANDGLLSNLSLVMGVAGAMQSNTAILIAGVAGLLAGASSMALGEWLSVQSSRELFEFQMKTEKEEIEASPGEETAELALIYQAKGLTEDEARRLAEQIMSDKTTALETLAREELGIDPQELGGSAWEAATTSFLLFAAGAVVPILPFLILGGSRSVPAALILSALGLFAIGAGTSLFTGRNPIFSGARQALFGAAAAGITYLVGHLIGASLLG
jgi:VIT1/CCC1 family predicted Fe2+/Mn2+ transporter